ncbi:MAG: serpin family protein [Gemmatimonadota bacterium]|jgi:serine protease inhibitor
MMRPLHTIAVLASAVVLLPTASCKSGTGPPKPPARIETLPRDLTVAEREIIDRSNDFAFQLLRQVRAQRSSPNTFLSPLSASMALGMTLNGAANATFDSMRATLGFEGLSQGEINRSYHDLKDLLTGLDPHVDLLIANATFARDGYPFVPSFFDSVTTWFDAAAQTLDFGNPSAVNTINQWASDNTEGLIPKVIDQITPDQILFLLNAVYFKGDWTDQFDKAHTSPSSFTLADGKRVQVPTMHGEIRVGRHWTPGVLVGELPYGGQAFVMDVVVPQDTATLDGVLAALNAQTWADWTGGFPDDYTQIEPIDVALPKLELKTEDTLNTPLSNMGMGIAFDPNRADFSHMVTPPPDVHIDFVKQNTYLKVDEEGTTAAAVTTVGMGVTAVPAGLIVDRPYLLVIRERLSGTILFIGAIGDPRASE